MEHGVSGIYVGCGGQNEGLLKMGLLSIVMSYELPSVNGLGVFGWLG